MSRDKDFTYTRRDIEFNADGATLRGWLYQPETDEARPAIVMTHGYNCIKELYLDKYAEFFAKAGFVVLVYDNRNFGDSDGEPRQELDPWRQVRDYRNAISFMQTLSCVDPEKIGIWGTSYSGGHVLVVAAIDKRVKCVVSQVPTISGWETMLRRVHPGQWADLRKQFEDDRLNRFLGHAPKTVPMITDPNMQEQASHSSADAWAFFTGGRAPEQDQWRFKKWTNEVTLRSLEMYSEYEPGSYIARIAPTPLLMIIADNDVVAPTDLALEAFNQATGIKKLHLFHGDHFSAYIELFEESAGVALNWFKQYLC
jgi:cephalosporin-C deacetylase-like acetyl esterase